MSLELLEIVRCRPVLLTQKCIKNCGLRGFFNYKYLKKFSQKIVESVDIERL